MGGLVFAFPHLDDETRREREYVTSCKPRSRSSKKSSGNFGGRAPSRESPRRTSGSEHPRAHQSGRARPRRTLPTSPLAASCPRRTWSGTAFVTICVNVRACPACRSHRRGRGQAGGKLAASDEQRGGFGLQSRAARMGASSEQVASCSTRRVGPGLTSQGALGTLSKNEVSGKREGSNSEWTRHKHAMRHRYKSGGAETSLGSRR